MALETETEVEQINTVADEQGNIESPANEKQQKQMAAALGNHGGLAAFEREPDTAAEALPASDVPDGVDVLIQAHSDNSDPIYVGTADAQPIEVPPGSGITLAVKDTGTIYVRAASAGDSVGVIHEEAV